MIELFKQSFHYDEKTGLFIDKKRNRVAGTKTKAGYIQISLKGKTYLAHRVAWLLHYGKFPKDVIDHINGKKADNRIENLRDVPQKINSRNRRNQPPNKYTGVPSIWKSKNPFQKDKYTCLIEGKPKRFSTLEKAIKAKDNERQENLKYLRKARQGTRAGTFYSAQKRWAEHVQPVRLFHTRNCRTNRGRSLQGN